MMTVNAASDPRVTLRFAMMGSGTMLAMKRPPAGPPTPMPRSRRVSGRLGIGLKVLNKQIECLRSRVMGSGADVCCHDFRTVK